MISEMRNVRAASADMHGIAPSMNSENSQIDLSYRYEFHSCKFNSFDETILRSVYHSVPAPTTTTYAIEKDHLQEERTRGIFLITFFLERSDFKNQIEY